MHTFPVGQFDRGESVGISIETKRRDRVRKVVDVTPESFQKEYGLDLKGRRYGRIVVHSRIYVDLSFHTDSGDDYNPLKRLSF